nr:hypothetical protein Iba_chr11eCG11700 [Ipomoea batatas]
MESKPGFQQVIFQSSGADNRKQHLKPELELLLVGFVTKLSTSKQIQENQNRVCNAFLQQAGGQDQGTQGREMKPELGAWRFQGQKGGDQRNPRLRPCCNSDTELDLDYEGSADQLVITQPIPTSLLPLSFFLQLVPKWPIVTLVNDIPSIFGKVSSSNPKITYEDMALLLKKFKKFLQVYRKQGSSSKKSSLAYAKVRWCKPTIEDYENLCYNCKKLGQFKVDFAHKEKESKEKNDNRRRRDKSVDKNKDRKGYCD